MAFGLCSWPVWKVDDFTKCFQLCYLRGLLPTLVTLISVIFLASRFLLHFLGLAQGNVTPSAIEHKSKLGYFIFKALAVFGLIAANMIAFALEAYGSRQNLWTLAELMTWLYVLVLAILQILLSASRWRTLELWKHLTTIYSIQWAFKLIQLWSAFVHPQLIQTSILITAEVALTSLLFSVAITQDNNTEMSLPWEEDLEPSREPQASLLSTITFSWILPLLLKGYRKVLHLEDVWDLVPKDKACVTLAEYRQLKTTAKLPWRLIYFFRFNLLAQCTYSSLASLISFTPVLLVQSILEYIENPIGKSRNAIWLFVLLLLFTNIAECFLDLQTGWISDKAMIRTRAIIQSEIFSKVLRRKLLAASDAEATNNVDSKVKIAPSTDANIINLINNDTTSIANATYYCYDFISAPIRLIGCMIILWRILGLSSIPSLVIIGLLLPINTLSSKSLRGAQRRMKTTSDKRIQITNESLLNLRILKLFAWVGRFAEMIQEKMSAELEAMDRWYNLWALVRVVETSTPFLMILLSFLAYTLFEKKPLYTSVAFAAMSVLGRIRGPVNEVVDASMVIVVAVGSTNRVQAMLEGPEIEKSELLSHGELHGDGDKKIGFLDASFTWGETAFRLSNLNINFAREKLNIVIGQTGSGKTSLLLALLGEMTKTKGNVFLKRDGIKVDSETGLTETVAFAAQKPWLTNDSIKKNIIFGSRMDEQRYRDVIIACGLKQDLDMLGDESPVGERGANVSGGQKQRISIARALYSNSRTVLLDDCLSSLDPETAKWIFEKCIKGPLMHNRTCILVTHNIKLCVPSSHYIVVLEDGEVAAKGTLESVLASGKLNFNETRTQSDIASDVSPTKIQRESDKASGKTAIPVAQGENGNSAKAEFQATGAVKLGVLALYLKSMGTWRFWLLGIILSATRPAISLTSDFWIRQWANQYNSATNLQDIDEEYNLEIYALIIFLAVLVSLLHRKWVVKGSITSVTYFSSRALHSVLNAAFSFLDTTPVGQLMNRFSEDIAGVPSAAFGAVSIKSRVIEIIITIILISTAIPIFLLPAIFITAMYIVVARIYIRSSRELKRMESVQNSPLCQHLGETIDGIMTIRAYGNEQRHEKENAHRINTYNRIIISRLAARRCLTFYLEILGALVLFCTALLIVLDIESVNAGTAGLILLYAMRFTSNLHYMVYEYGDCELKMNGIERLKEYIEIEPEKDFIGTKVNLPPNWPDQGCVEFVDFTTRYRPGLEPVLEGIGIKIGPGEKFGIVGRTGSGKTSLVLSLIRVLEAETGKILIDGIEIGRVPLVTLREKIAFIPQDAVLFSGTIRSNLDPFTLYTDEDIFAVLQQVQLIGGCTATATDTEYLLVDSISTEANVFLNLLSPVMESGDNFSLGQRQLLCLARALLKHSNIIVMDEATASIDYDTDARVQEVIRNLKGTIITVAHRLQTIIDYDKVLVMENGKVSTFGHPYELLSGGVFRRYCEESGDFEALKKRAKETYGAHRLVDDE